MNSNKNNFAIGISFRVLVIFIVLSSLGGLVSPVQNPAAAQTLDQGDEISGIYRGVSTAVQFDISPELRSMTPQEVAEESNLDLRDLPSGLEGPLGPQDVDSVVQTAVGAGEIPSPSVNFDGFTNQLTYTPPDPNGEVGLNHYVAMANVHFAIYSKTGTLLYGPVANNTLWAGFGGPCQIENSGDPIVIYDQIADRWMLTQFTSAGPTYYNCVALSTTADPLGTYYRWAFSTGTNFPDYPKYGIWGDGYYISTREFAGGGSFAGIGAYALNRDEMLIGDPTPDVISFLAAPGGTPYNVGDGLLPADLDGMTLPPAGSPEYFMGSMDNGGPYGAPQDALTLWEFHVDWAIPGNSTFILAATLPVAAYDSIFPCSPGSRDCIPQPGTTEKVDILSYRQRPMWRLAYRNFGTYEALVTNQSVEATTGIAGIRWYEVRSPDTSPVVYQEGTYAPGASDGIHRWMGSIAMDQSGNMALGYSASDGTSTFPSSWYTGRLVSDPLGSMPQGEGIFVNGLGSQLSTGSRWGDYTSMTVDPVDDCTFWFINEYYPVTHATAWRLRIGSFSFPTCGSTEPIADLSLDKSVDPSGTILPGSLLTYTLSVTNNGPDGNYPLDYDNFGFITINDSGIADPYPSIISVPMVSGVISRVEVALHNLNHTYPDDIDVILVSPGGESAYLMSDAGNGFDIFDVELTFADDAMGTLPDGALITSGAYQPTDFEGGDVLPAPAPGGPYATNFSVFNGFNPTGDWSLFVFDDTGGDQGSIVDGWTLTLTLSTATVYDTLPAGVSVVDITAPDWTCSQDGQVITCDIADLPAFSSSEIEIVATAPTFSGIITNTAIVSSYIFDPDPSNNDSSVANLVDTAPVAVDDAYQTPMDTPLVVPAPGVLGNDTDPDMDSLTVVVDSGPVHGTLTLNPDGSFTYTPDPGYVGADSFTYIVDDGYLTDIGQVDLTIEQVNYFFFIPLLPKN